MKNKFILLELNHRNEIRADVNMTIKSLDITKIGHINVKIDTGCPYTSIPIRKLGISNEKAWLMKQSDCADPSIRKEISFGVNDSKEKREADKEKFKTGKSAKERQKGVCYERIQQVSGNYSGILCML